MRNIKKGVYFITGAYGVGKTTLCKKLSCMLSVPYFSASELISAQNKEMYGANKTVKDKIENQNILKEAIAQKLIDFPTFFLNGHTAIFKRDNTVDLLPAEAFQHFNLVAIILLEAPSGVLLEHLNNRDQISYSKKEISSLIVAEGAQAQGIAEKLRIPLIRHTMRYDNMDCNELLAYLLGEKL